VLSAPVCPLCPSTMPSVHAQEESGLFYLIDHKKMSSSRPRCDLKTLLRKLSKLLGINFMSARQDASPRVVWAQAGKQFSAAMPGTSYPMEYESGTAIALAWHTRGGELIRGLPSQDPHK